MLIRSFGNLNHLTLKGNTITSIAIDKLNNGGTNFN